MYTNKKLEIIQDNDQYKSIVDGTKYPRNFPKDEIAELFPVTLVDRPADTATTLVIGFHINENYWQVWDVRKFTQEELDIKAKQRWEHEMSSTDIGMSRGLEDHIRIQHNELTGEKYSQDRYNAKKIKRQEGKDKGYIPND